jgi:thymidine phosphorylase
MTTAKSGKPLSDEDMAALVMAVRTNTAASRLADSEVIALLRALEADGVTLTVPTASEPVSESHKK